MNLCACGKPSAITVHGVPGGVLYFCQEHRSPAYEDRVAELEAEVKRLKEELAVKAIPVGAITGSGTLHLFEAEEDVRAWLQDKRNYWSHAAWINKTQWHPKGGG